MILLACLRLTSGVPVLFLADSSKYIVPDQIALAHNIDFIWTSINFSVLERLMNYYIQIFNQNDLSLSIFFNKIFSLATTFLVYWIVFRSSTRIVFALIAALIVSLNPALLYIEQAIMAESMFLLLIMMVVALLQEVLLHVLELNSRRFYCIASLAGFIAGLAAITKQTADNWIVIISLVVFSLGIFYFIRNKRYQLILIAVLFFVCSFVPKIPLYLGNCKNFGKFDLSLSHTIDSGRGVFLWSLTPDMLYAAKSNSYPWLTQMIIALTEDIKTQITINDTSSNTQAFYIAISRINVVGREGRLQHPYTGMPISIEEWSKICLRYWFDLSFAQPDLLIKRILELSATNLFLKEDLGLFILENSLRQGVNFQPIQYTKVPFSSKSQLDPKLSGLNAESLSIQSWQITKARDFYSYFKLNSGSENYLLMVNMDTPYVFKMPCRSFSIRWQSLWAWFPWVYIIGPLFVMGLVLYLIQRRFELFDLFILGSTLYFTLLPLLFSLAEARYRLQFLPFMIIFITIVLAKNFNKAR